MTIDLGPEEFGLSDTLAADLGAFVSENAHRYPTVFSSCSPRDIAKHHNSKYRMVEWAAVFHHFVPAFLYDIKAPDEVQTMVSEFIIASDAAMSDQGMTSNEVDELQARIHQVRPKLGASLRQQ
ncbi:unnamed protein product [Tilletia controversa]|nr:hypothetical protein CF335_g7290 [Tilletia laevis]CAD6912097.1 unnamed protein product [Tilletia controversa]